MDEIIQKDNYAVLQRILLSKPEQLETLPSKTQNNDNKSASDYSTPFLVNPVGLPSELSLVPDQFDKADLDLESLIFSCCDLGAMNCLSVLLDAGLNKDCLDTERQTLLMRGVKARFLEVIRLLIAWGCQLDSLGGVEGQSALHLAAQQGDFEISKALIEAGANVNIKNEKEDTPLMLASMSGHLNIVKLLLDCHASINRRGFHELSALHAASKHGHYEICSYLITAKAGVEDEDRFGTTPLICAAEKGHVNLVLLFLAQGADVNRVTHSGSTALHYAAKEGWITCCKVLLHHGAETDAQDIRRFTPLIVASAEGHFKVVQLLLEARCNCHMTSYNRRTALHYAAEQGYSQCCQILIDAGTRIEGMDSDLCTPIMLSAAKGNVETTSLLIDCGACLSHSTRHGLSILHLAAESDNVDCCDLLLKHNLDIDVRGGERITPLICAIRRNHTSVITYLMSRGCALNKHPLDSMTALNEAIEANIKFEIIEKILINGANPDTIDEYFTLPLWQAVESENLPVVKLLLQCNSQQSVKRCCLFRQCSPCTPLVHAIHIENITLVHWLLSASGETEARSIFEILNSLNPTYSLPETTNSLGGPISSDMIQCLKTFIKTPQSLLCQCRRAVRRTLGCGYKVNQRINSLMLPTLLHRYMLYNDLEP